MWTIAPAFHNQPNAKLFHEKLLGLLNKFPQWIESFSNYTYMWETDIPQVTKMDTEINKFKQELQKRG
jgi:hypothetical protein